MLAYIDLTACGGHSLRAFKFLSDPGTPISPKFVIMAASMTLAHVSRFYFRRHSPRDTVN
jgi:hypothetical protein